MKYIGTVCVLGGCVLNISLIVAAIYVFIHSLAVGYGKTIVMIVDVNSYNEGYFELFLLFILLIYVIYDTRYRIVEERIKNA